MWIYCAADAADDAGKSNDNMIVLNRSEMWDATKIPGCKSRYEFETVRDSETHPTNPRTRAYPCPCAACRGKAPGQSCSNIDIVGSWQYLRINKVPRAKRSSNQEK